MQILTRVKCDYCKGTGKNPAPPQPTLEHEFYDDECYKCKGTGKVEKWIDLDELRFLIYPFSRIE